MVVSKLRNVAAALVLFVAGLGGAACGGGNDPSPDAVATIDAVEPDARQRLDAMENTAATVCAEVCGKVATCGGDPTSCEADCPPDLTECDAVQLQDILDCLELSCGPHEKCLFSVACFGG